MKKFHFRAILSAICMASILAAFTKVSAGPVRFDQVVQVIDAQPGKSQVGSFTRLRLADGYTSLFATDDDDDKKNPGQTQDGRVITDTKIDIVKDSDCNCEDVRGDEHTRGFPKWALLGLAAIPIAFIIIKRKKDTPTPTATLPPPPQTTTPTPPPTTTPTPPNTTPTPPPEPVPEPMTILLFGTGLASIGMAARRRFGKKGEQSTEGTDEEQ